MPVRRALSIVVASKHLPLYPWGETWCRQLWKRHLDAWTHDGADVLVMAPEGQGWALEMAQRAGFAWVELRRDGVWRESLAPDKRWAPEGETQHPHRVTDKLLMEARMARFRGWEVEIVTLRMMGRRESDGVAHFVTQALLHRFEIDGYTHLGLEAV